MKAIEFTPNQVRRLSHTSWLSPLHVATLLAAACCALFGRTSVGAGEALGILAQENLPTISSFSPTVGPVGTEVTIQGVNLSGATDVAFNGVAASFHEGGGDTLVAVVPTGATTGAISVTTEAARATSPLNFTVSSFGPPVITGFSPDRGPVGAAVVISGSNFAGVSDVRFNNAQADFTLFGNTVTAFVPSNASSGVITVTTPAGTGVSTGIFTVTLADEPIISSLDPIQGPPGARVTINGKNLTSVTSVTFSGVAADFSVFGTSIFAIVPDGARTGPIIVLSPDGSASSPVTFTVLDPLAPQIVRFIPEAGGPGTVVTITGTNLANVTEARFGGVPGVVLTASSGELAAMVPIGAVTGPISLTSSIGTGVSAGTFYATPRVLSFVPSSGPVGTAVVIRGANFSDAVAVQFSGVDATFTVISASEIRTVVPAGAISGLISIATPAGFGSSTGPFLLPPSIARIDPTSGQGSSIVTITGQNLLGTTSVRFGAIEAAFIPVSVTTVSATVPAAAVNGPVTVTTLAGSATSAQTFFVGQFSDLAVGLKVAPATGVAGDILSYTLTATNRGPLEAQSVVITERLPAGVRLNSMPAGADCVEANNIITCRLDVLAVGTDFSIRIPVTIVSGPYLTNQVSIASDNSELIPADNIVTLITPLEGVPPLDEPVTLTAVLLGGGLQLSWPASATAMILENTAAVGSAASWRLVNATPVVINGRNIVSQSTSGSAAFYRLRKL